MSETCTRSSIVVLRDRTGFGANRMASITRRAGSATLVAGTEYLPFDSGVAPAGSEGPEVCTVVVAFEAAGAPVTYTATVTDNVDPNPTISCQPESGSIFPVGETIVSCTGRDASGNEAHGSLTVTVIAPWDFTLGLGSTGSVNTKTDVVTVQGTASCNRTGGITAFGELEQVVARRATIVGSFSVSFEARSSRCG